MRCVLNRPNVEVQTSFGLAYGRQIEVDFLRNHRYLDGTSVHLLGRLLLNVSEIRKVLNSRSKGRFTFSRIMIGIDFDTIH